MTRKGSGMPEKDAAKEMGRASFLKLGLVGLSAAALAAACGGEEEEEEEEEED